MRTRRARERRIRITVLCTALAFAAAPTARALNAGDEEPLGIDEVAPVESHERARVGDPHDPSRALHPVRVAAYALHPVGVALDWILVRPAVWIGRQEPFRTIFGYED